MHDDRHDDYKLIRLSGAHRGKQNAPLGVVCTAIPRPSTPQNRCRTDAKYALPFDTLDLPFVTLDAVKWQAQNPCRTDANYALVASSPIFDRKCWSNKVGGKGDPLQGQLPPKNRCRTAAIPTKHQSPRPAHKNNIDVEQPRSHPNSYRKGQLPKKDRCRTARSVC